MKGKAHVYPRENINTDEIIPARYLNTDQEEELAQHAMEGIDENFKEKVKEGDFLVTGENFGCGSSREHAVWALRGTGIRAIIGKSFARIFYRNCINNGLVALECKGIHHKVQEGNKLQIDLREGKIRNLDKREEYQFTPLPKFMINIIKAGGLLPYIKIKQKDEE